ncbi:MAG: GNAT family N-acetyltransferase [Telluria sp.]
MSSCWQLRDVKFKFQVSDLTFFSIAIPLQVRAERLCDDTMPASAPIPPSGELIGNSQGFVIRGLPLTERVPKLSKAGDYLCYAQQQYDHYYIDLSTKFEDYQSKFSSKTRSTIMRKVRKFAEQNDGVINWKTYKSAEDIEEFFDLACALSKTTYQDRLLDAGLPDSPEFRKKAVELAKSDQVRAYILFHGERPVAYLYCPIEEAVLSYSHVGYDPAYMHLSVGTVLQWLATQQLFEEAKFRYFDFTEGQSEHKRLFATHERWCGNIVMVKRSPRNIAIIRAHHAMDHFSGMLGEFMERHGLKARVKRMLRFAR